MNADFHFEAISFSHPDQVQNQSEQSAPRLEYNCDGGTISNRTANAAILIQHINRLARPSHLISIHPGTHFLDMVGCDIFIVFHHLIDNAVRSQFDNAVSHGFDKLMVV